MEEGKKEKEKNYHDDDTVSCHSDNIAERQNEELQRYHHLVVVMLNNLSVTGMVEGGEGRG